MDCNSTRIPYRQANAFPRIALDYIDQEPGLKPFYSYPPNVSGIQQAIEDRKKVNTDRALLVDVLTDQYAGTDTNKKVQENIKSLLSPNSFTITTAHQNNIFTGPLYFIYKIVHAIRLAEHLNQVLPGNHFVPVFYVGSEDADLAELNHIFLEGEKLEWKTDQTGAVGRMVVDKELVSLMSRMEGRLTVLPKGHEFIGLLQKHYRPGIAIQDATFGLVNELFGTYGLVVVLPDNPRLKKSMREIFKDDLLNQTASKLTQQATLDMEKAGYDTQANAREINLFYLKDQSRERIVKEGSEWKLVNGKDKFTETKLLDELEKHPERFSPNVILRGLYQEMILPNIAFIGGGGETAYWLQLKALFNHYMVPFPVLVLRNSFLIVEEKWRDSISHLGFETADFFLSENELVKKWVTREAKVDTKLNGSLSELEKLYDLFRKQASAVDTTLEKHVDALRMKTVYRLQELEKKMLRAEKRKYTDQQRQIRKVRSVLFPNGGLQERYENLSYYYSLWGKEFIQRLIEFSPALEQEFTIINEAG